jgi:hypothetical protein
VTWNRVVTENTEENSGKESEKWVALLSFTSPHPALTRLVALHAWRGGEPNAARLGVR